MTSAAETDLIIKLDTVNISPDKMNIENKSKDQTPNNSELVTPAAGFIKEDGGGAAAAPSSPTPEFYNKAQKYWSTVPATVNGMLGGLGYISAIDIQGSNVFLREIRVPGHKLALDCGAGIGRVSRNLLMPRFHCVDLVEQDPAFAEKAREYCEQDKRLGNNLGEIYNVGLQEFRPTKQYDLIWSQWVLGHLTDDDLVKFFKRIRLGLKTDSYFCLKENISSTKKVILDDKDSSVTRPLEQYERFLKEAGFRIVRKVRQQNFPKGLFPVYMIACKPHAKTN